MYSKFSNKKNLIDKKKYVSDEMMYLIELRLIGDGSDEGGQGVVTHEGVDTHAKQVWEAPPAGRHGSAAPAAPTDHQNCPGDHHGQG